ncbi:MAG TPA: SdpI family protein [Candidatus Saccharimonadales bacterium]|nr:SdpI family protein [Candidatus Saccharimonadales bacterium]
MNVRRYVLISLGLVAGMLLVSAWAWPQLPPGAQIPIHWNINGRANGFAPRELGLFFVPLLALVLTGLFAIVPRVEPRRANLMRSSRAYGAVWIGVLCVMFVLHVVTTLIVLGHPLAISTWVHVALGLLFMVIGNYLGKVRSNFMFGIRTPWTLSSDLSWNRTHRLGGRLFVVFGFAMVVVGLIGEPRLATSILIGGLIAIAVVLTVYSYLVWRADPDRGTFGSANR